MTRPRPPSGLAKFDSASVMVLALAAFLHGRDFPALGQSRLLQYPGSLADWLPRGVRQRLFAFLGAREGVKPEMAGSVSTDAIAEWFTRLYPRRRYPAVIVGSSSGALVHLAAALGIPWLPQTFLTPVRQTDVHPDDAVGAMVAGRDAAGRFLDANPDVQLHHMHDPSQDRLMLSGMTYFRSKFRRLPSAYRDFIGRSLEPNGTIIIAECSQSWPTTRLGENHVYQFGAVGGPTIHEYFHGSRRVRDYLARYDSPWQRWEPPAPDEESPEAEWGFEPSLRDHIVPFAREHGFQVLRFLFEEPGDPSPFVADLHRAWYRERGLPADRLVIESFILIEPYWMLRTGSVPFWTTFNTEPSLAWARRYLAKSAPFEHIDLTVFPHGVDSVGVPPVAAWKALPGSAREGGALLGVDGSAYPAHFSAFARFHRELRALPARHSLPEPLHLDPVVRFIETADPGYAVRLERDLGEPRCETEV